MSDIIDIEPVDNERAQSLKTVGWISYLLHLIVAVAAVVPGAQVGAGLLIVALIIISAMCYGPLAALMAAVGPVSQAPSSWVSTPSTTTLPTAPATSARMS